MDNETYEALKRIMTGVDKNEDIPKEDFERVGAWIDGMGKKYCPTCGELNHRCKPND